MNNESITRFYATLANDPELMSRAERVGGDMDALAALAGELGYDISAEDLRAYQDKARLLLKSRLQKVQQGPATPQSPGVKAFFALTKLAETDEGVAKRLAEIGSDAPDELIAYGKELGFIFSQRDMADIGKEILEPSDELNDEELELVAGGTTLAAVAILFVGVGLALGGAVGVGGGAAAAGAALGVLAVLKSI